MTLQDHGDLVVVVGDPGEQSGSDVGVTTLRMLIVSM